MQIIQYQSQVAGIALMSFFSISSRACSWASFATGYSPDR